MSLKTSQKRRSDQLFKENPYCPSCGILMTPVTKDRHKSQPDTMVTYAHAFSKYNDKRGVHGEAFVNGILCKKCNMAFSRNEEIELGVEAMRRRSNSYPLGELKLANQ